MVWQLEQYQCPSCKHTHPLVWQHPREPDRSVTYAYTCPVTHEAVENIKLKDVKEQRTFAAPESVHVRRMQE
jgi:hypothetical protein